VDCSWPFSAFSFFCGTPAVRVAWCDERTGYGEDVRYERIPGDGNLMDLSVVEASSKSPGKQV